MTVNSTATDATHTGTNWQVEYDIELIEIRDGIAEALGVLEPGDPFVVTYAVAVKEAGTPARLPRAPIESSSSASTPCIRTAIQSEARSSCRQRVPGTTRPTGRIISYMIGATEDDGFSGLAGGYCGRRDLLCFDAFDPDTPELMFRF